MVGDVWFGKEIMYEKRLKAVPPQLFTTDGTVNGKITVVNTDLFKVKQEVIIFRTGQPNINLEIKRIDDINTIWVGPLTQTIDKRSDMSAYTVAAGSGLMANEQKRPSIPSEEVNRAVYEEEPTVALRTMLVDKQGNNYNSQNRLPVNIDAEVTIAGDINVQLTHKDNDPELGDIHDSIRLGDGINEITATKAALGNVAGLDTVRKNALFTKPYDQITVLTKNDDGDPLTIRTRYGGVNIQLATLIYDSDGDFEDVQVSDL